MKMYNKFVGFTKSKVTEKFNPINKRLLLKANSLNLSSFIIFSIRRAFNYNRIT